MIIVCGRLLAHRGKRQDLLELSREAVDAARRTDGCLDFAVSPDLLDPDRVNIFEKWTDAEALHRFRSTGPGQDISSLVRQFDVSEYDLGASR